MSSNNAGNFMEGHDGASFGIEPGLVIARAHLGQICVIDMDSEDARAIIITLIRGERSTKIGISAPDRYYVGRPEILDKSQLYEDIRAGRPLTPYQRGMLQVQKFRSTLVSADLAGGRK